MSPTDEDKVMMTLIARLDSIDKRLSSIERLGALVEAALGAVAIQSQNAHEIESLKARLTLLERRLPPAVV